MKIMFICTGNICRSAMAEGIMKKLVKENKLNDIEVCSCGMYEQTGEYATYNAVEAAKLYGADISNHRATYIRNSKIEEMDLILCATNSHKQMVISIYPNLVDKVFTMKEYAGIDNMQDIDIKDPWGYDLNVYYNCVFEINECLEKTIEIIKNKRK